jgi:ubiquinone/menaquinone biosynthesis C-methylase UbiE
MFSKVMKTLSSFHLTLEEINVDGAGKPGAGHASVQHHDGVQAKSNIAAAYDATATANLTAMWNWGLHDDKVAHAIEEHIPGFVDLHSDGLSEELYFFTLQQVPFDLADYAKRSILEVGCGSGGGLNFLSRIVDADSIVGLDISSGAVRQANAAFSRGRKLRFIKGDAEELPFSDGELDVVLNVESSHNYPDIDKFLGEVARVLKPGGYFSHVDTYTADRFTGMQRAKAAVRDLEWIHERDITQEVRASIHRRMAPGSFLRTRVEERTKSVPLPIRAQARSHIMGGYGAKFAGYGDSPQVRLMRRIGRVATNLPWESYRLSVARRL